VKYIFKIYFKIKITAILNTYLIKVEFKKKHVRIDPFKIIFLKK
jgi:hypothetical protein